MTDIGGAGSVIWTTDDVRDVFVDHMVAHSNTPLTYEEAVTAFDSWLHAQIAKALGKVERGTALDLDYFTHNRGGTRTGSQEGRD